MTASCLLPPSVERPAPAVFIGWQSGSGVIADFPLFNLTEDLPRHPAGSTVSAKTLIAAGFTPPAYPENQAA